jgi:pyruvate,water dikinase
MCMPCASLPSAFRLGSDGEVVPLGPAGAAATGGVPAGGGRASGPVHVGDGIPPEGSVLVVRHLQPQLAGVLPRLAGLVSETGSPLSHLAILAREMNLPVVVGVPDAVSRFAEGAALVVDGSTGEVAKLEELA